MKMKKLKDSFKKKFLFTCHYTDTLCFSAEKSARSRSYRPVCTSLGVVSKVFCFRTTWAPTLLFLGIIFSNSVYAAESASLILEPLQKKIYVGEQITAKIMLSNSTGARVNAVDGVLEYPTNLLQAKSVSKSNSLVTLWAEEPKIDSVGGKVTFAGGSQTPFTALKGQVVSIVFKAIANGTVNFKFNSQHILIADGLGTDITISGSDSVWQIEKALPIVPRKIPIDIEEEKSKPTTAPQTFKPSAPSLTTTTTTTTTTPASISPISGAPILNSLKLDPSSSSDMHLRPLILALILLTLMATKDLGCRFKVYTQAVKQKRSLHFQNKRRA